MRAREHKKYLHLLDRYPNTIVKYIEYGSIVDHRLRDNPIVYGVHVYTGWARFGETNIVNVFFGFK